MLTLPEKILFALAALASLAAVYRAVQRIVRTLGRGKGQPDWSLLPKRLVTVFPKVLVLQPTYKIRFWPNLFHILIVWGFLYFLLVNPGDILHGFLPDFHFLGRGLAGQLHRLLADLASVSVLSGMLAMIIRRFIFRPATLTARQDVLLHPKARFGIWRDSAIVGSFVLVHVGSRLLEQTFNLAREGLDCLAAGRLLVGWFMDRRQPGFPAGRRTHRLLAGRRHRFGLPALFPLFQARPHVLRPAQLLAQAAPPLDRRAGQAGLQR